MLETHAETESITCDARPRRRLYDTSEAATSLSISRAELYRRMDAGELESVKLGRRRLIPAEALDKFVDALRSAS